MSRVFAVAVACLCGTAWGGSWTHDSTDGAATVVALPGGQVTLDHDGADRQARSITYVPTIGATTTITRDYGPSWHKAVEVENGTLRQHVYGAGPAPLLRVEGDGSLIYQVGPDTISVDGTGSVTVAHLVTDIKQSTVAVLDAQGQPRQQVAYSTLGQATSKQNSGNVYVAAAQSRGYEGLNLLLLSKEGGKGLGEDTVQDQLIDNRERVYFSSAGRFLALDAAGMARAYEARGNNWIMFADYDGNMTELVEAIKKDRKIVVAFGDNHDKHAVIKLWLWFLSYLQSEKIRSTTFAERGLLYYETNEGVIWNKRVVDMEIEERIAPLLDKGLLQVLGGKGSDQKLEEGEEDIIRAQLAEQNKLVPEVVKDYTFEYHPYSTKPWNISRLRKVAQEKNRVLILLVGAKHLQEPVKNEDLYYENKKTGETYIHTFFNDLKLSWMQHLGTLKLVPSYDLVGLTEDEDYKTELPMLEIKKYMEEAEVNYTIFAPKGILDKHNALQKMFGKSDQDDEKNEEKEEGGALAKGDGLQPVIKPPSQKPEQHDVKEEKGESEEKEEKMN